MLHLSTVSNIFAWLLDFIFPRRCTGCGRGGTYLCRHCLGRAEPAADSPLPATYAAFSYHERSIRRAIWLLKYRGVRELGETFGGFLYERFAEEISELAAWHQGHSQPFLVIPIPQSKQRARARGYNQAALIALAFAHSDPAHFELGENILVKIKDTPTQVSLKVRAERVKNLDGAFQVIEPEKIKDRQIILIDDVITTGATVTESRKILKNAGARTIIALAIAHG